MVFVGYSNEEVFGELLFWWCSSIIIVGWEWVFKWGWYVFYMREISVFVEKSEHFGDISWRDSHIFVIALKLYYCQLIYRFLLLLLKKL